MTYISDRLREIATSDPDHVALKFKGKETTYSELYNQSLNLASYLQQKHLTKKDIVVLFLNNSDNFLISYYACHLGGVIVLPINTKLSESEIQFIMEDSNASVIIYDDDYKSLIDKVTLNLTSLKEKIVVNGDELTVGGNFRNILTGDYSKDHVKPFIADDDTAVIFYTSGTTGKPKGVMLTNKNCAAVARINSHTMEITETDNVLIITPLFHCGGAHTMSIPSIYAGATVVIEERFSVQKNLRSIEDEKITLFFGVTAIVSRFLDSPYLTSTTFSFIRLIAMGAGPVPFEIIKKLKNKFSDIKVMNLYGQTENSPAATALPDKDIFDKIGSVGKAAIETKIKVVDKRENEVAFNEVGEVLVKGPQVMKGYFNNEEETNKSLKNGWLYTGDLGKVDEEGFLYLVDRKNDLIIRGGENIYPIEIEEELYKIPEVLESAVIGTSHNDLGEVPVAYVVLKESGNLTEEEILGFCGKRLARYKVPTKVFFIDKLPRNANGKVLKRELKNNKA